MHAMTNGPACAMEQVMAKLVFAFALACMATVAAAAELVIPPVVYPRLAHNAATPEAFVPKGWRLQLEQVAIKLRQASPLSWPATAGHPVGF